MSESDIFGEVIFSYSRAQALDDGMLVDVSERARRVGILYPVALTHAVYETIKTTEFDEEMGQSFEGRLADLLLMFRTVAKQVSGDTLLFSIRVQARRSDGKVITSSHQFKALCGPGDSFDPVITIMLPGED